MKKILLIEDDQITQQMYQAKLAREGYTVTFADNGEDGLKYALSLHPDLILLDLAMPKMDGMTMLSNLRQDSWGKDVPVIVLTNVDTSDKILKEVVEYHPAYYLMKVETTPETVFEKVQEIIGGAVN